MAAGQRRCPYQILCYVRGVGSLVCYFSIIKLLYSSLHDTHTHTHEISTSMFEEKGNLFERHANFSSYQAAKTLSVYCKDQYVMEISLFVLGIRTSKSASFKVSKL